MPGNKKPRKKMQRKEVKIPITGLHSEIALQLHGSLVALRLNPNEEAFCAAAQIFNVVGLALMGSKFKTESRVVDGAVRTMNVVSAKLDNIIAGHQSILSAEMQTIINGANAIDSVLPKLTVNELYKAMQFVNKLKMENVDG